MYLQPSGYSPRTERRATLHLPTTALSAKLPSPTAFSRNKSARGIPSTRGRSRRPDRHLADAEFHRFSWGLPTRGGLAALVDVEPVSVKPPGSLHGQGGTNSAASLHCVQYGLRIEVACVGRASYHQRRRNDLTHVRKRVRRAVRCSVAFLSRRVSLYCRKLLKSKSLAFVQADSALSCIASTSISRAIRV